jgi:hypothetical protein
MATTTVAPATTAVPIPPVQWGPPVVAADSTTDAAAGDKKAATLVPEVLTAIQQQNAVRVSATTVAPMQSVPVQWGPATDAPINPAAAGTQQSPYVTQTPLVVQTITAAAAAPSVDACTGVIKDVCKKTRVCMWRQAMCSAKSQEMLDLQAAASTAADTCLGAVQEVCKTVRSCMWMNSACFPKPPILGPADTSECVCKSKWDFEGASYSGCTITPDDLSTAWCYTTAPCAGSTASEVLLSGVQWAYCGETPELPSFEAVPSSRSNSHLGWVITCLLIFTIVVVGLLVRQRKQQQQQQQYRKIDGTQNGDLSPAGKYPSPLKRGNYGTTALSAKKKNSAFSSNGFQLFNPFSFLRGGVVAAGAARPFIPERDYEDSTIEADYSLDTQGCRLHNDGSDLDTSNDYGVPSATNPAKGKNRAWVDPEEEDLEMEMVCRVDPTPQQSDSVSSPTSSELSVDFGEFSAQCNTAPKSSPPRAAGSKLVDASGDEAAQRSPIKQVLDAVFDLLDGDKTATEEVRPTAPAGTNNLLEKSTDSIEVAMDYDKFHTTEM